jgi:choline dehydrogenase-like flavoprotein
VKARDLPLTANHIFGSCPMSKGAAKGPVDELGPLAGVEGVWVADASLFPSPSAVNPQATIMALSDVITRRIAELDR